jgi:sensor histidine kinase regulating citrate/malate metabolism
VAAVEDPVLAALLLGKTAQASERGITLSIDGEVSTSRYRIEPRDVVTLAGNLVDNALDAASGREGPRVQVTVTWDETHLRLRVGDNGPGIPEADHEHVLDHGWSTKAGDGAARGVGLALVSQAARRNGGSVRIGRSPLGGAEVEVTVGEPA